MDELTHKGNSSVIIRWERLLVSTLQLLWDHLGVKMILQLNRPTGYIKWQEKKRHQTLEMKSYQKDIRKTNQKHDKRVRGRGYSGERKKQRKGSITGLIHFVILFKVFFTAILTSLFLRL